MYNFWVAVCTASVNSYSSKQRVAQSIDAQNLAIASQPLRLPNEGHDINWGSSMMLEMDDGLHLAVPSTITLACFHFPESNTGISP